MQRAFSESRRIALARNDALNDAAAYDLWHLSGDM